MASPHATMTDSWRKALTTCIYDGTTPILQNFIWGSGGNFTSSDNVTLQGDINLGSKHITHISDFSNIKASQLISGTGIPDSTYISEVLESKFAGNLTAGSTTITKVSNFAGLEVNDLILGTNIPSGALISSLDELGQTMVISIAATATATGNALTAGSILISNEATATGAATNLQITGPKREDPTLVALGTPLGLTKAITASDKVLAGDGYSATFTGSLDDNDLVNQNISEFGIMDSTGKLAYYFTFTEVFKTLGEAYQLQITVKF